MRESEWGALIPGAAHKYHMLPEITCARALPTLVMKAIVLWACEQVFRFLSALKRGCNKVWLAGCGWRCSPLLSPNKAMIYQGSFLFLHLSHKLPLHREHPTIFDGNFFTVQLFKITILIPPQQALCIGLGWIWVRNSVFQISFQKRKRYQYQDYAMPLKWFISKITFK